MPSKDPILPLGLGRFVIQEKAARIPRLWLTWQVWVAEEVYITYDRKMDCEV